ncbi:MAG: hypothetical protein MI923_23565 [Phycisphaerales bacterium]|nr:hypothetical protein [Phycisphaerales bacterium]
MSNRIRIQRRLLVPLLTVGAAVLISQSRAAAYGPGDDMDGDDVLVVYNSVSPEAIALKNSYLVAHPDIPAANVLDLDDDSLVVADLSYADFVTKIRNPIRSYLSLPGQPGPSDIIAIVLIRPFPHRILDTDAGAVGDSRNAAGTEFLPPSNGGQGDATFASVDAELVLLWQNLDIGEAGGTMDSRSDNMVDNPYHQSATRITAFGRANIQTQKTFINQLNVVWRIGGAGATQLTPGDMYLVCRIDGNSLSQAQALIERSQDIFVNKAVVRVLLDEYDVNGNNELDDDALISPGSPFLAGDDFEETVPLLQADGWDVRYDGTADFIDSTEETLPLIAYASYGENHDIGGFGENPPGSGIYINNFNFPPGAMFNTLESYNGRALNGLGTLFGQEQSADFIAAGGTFAIGNVWEPFTFTLADNEFLFPRMLVDGVQWGEAAYMAIPALSWHHIVIGDPLAYYQIIDDPGLPKGDLDGDGQVNGDDIRWFVQIVLNGPAGYRTVFPTLDPIARADFTGDFVIETDDAPGFVNMLLGP